MGVYHFVLVHFPIALWIGASLLIFLRVVNDGAPGHVADRALPVFLVGGCILGLLTYLNGFQVWSWEALSATPMGRNHTLTATWSLVFYALLMIVRLRHGDALWHGVARWVMLVLSGVGAVFVGISGTLGGHLAGNVTPVGEVLRLLGWEIYTTYYVPTLTVVLLVGLGVVMDGLGLMTGRKSAS